MTKKYGRKDKALQEKTTKMVSLNNSHPAPFQKCYLKTCYCDSYDADMLFDIFSIKTCYKLSYSIFSEATLSLSKCRININ